MNRPARELPAFAQGATSADDQPSRPEPVICSGCGKDKVWVARESDTRKFCNTCGHQGAKPKEQCGCFTCISGRVAKTGRVVPQIAPAAGDARHCPTCTCHHKKGERK